jgi:hypothetical protein
MKKTGSFAIHELHEFHEFFVLEKNKPKKNPFLTTDSTDGRG